jgi:hypothetical protein
MFSVSVELEDFVEVYHDCTDFKDIYKSLSTSTDVNPQHVYPEYCIGQDGLLCFNDGISILTYVPSSKRADILELIHDLPLGAHLGAVKLKKAVMSSFYFPRITTHIEAYVSSCEHCQRNKNYTTNTRGIPTPKTTPLC